MSGAAVTTQTPARAWPDEIFEVFKKVNIEQIAYVPDAGHTQLIKACEADNSISAVSLTSEEEGVAMLAGAWLGGQRGALLMQSSGSGNCTNMLGMIVECRFPLLMLITMRGQWGEFNPWQLPMAQATAPTLSAIGAIVQTVDDADRVEETVSAAAQLAFNTCRPVAVLISQRIVGTKQFK